jgi:hypothetical protein
VSHERQPHLRHHRTSSPPRARWAAPVDGDRLRLRTLDNKIAAAAGAGFDGIELFENDLVVTPWTPAEVRARCADVGLTIDLYQPFRDFEAVPPAALAANLARAEHKFDVGDSDAPIPEPIRPYRQSGIGVMLPSSFVDGIARRWDRSSMESSRGA